MKNKFKISFGKMNYGWQNISLYNNKQFIFCASASYAFPPYNDIYILMKFLYGHNILLDKKLRDYIKNYYYFYERRFAQYKNTFCKIRNNTYSLFIDQEGYEGVMQFKIVGEYVYITTDTLKDSTKDSYSDGGRKQTKKYKKSDVIKSFIIGLKHLKQYVIKEKIEEPIFEIMSDGEICDTNIHFHSLPNIDKILKLN